MRWIGAAGVLLLGLTGQGCAWNMTAKQRDEIYESREDVKKGLVIDNALLDKEIKAFLNKQPNTS